MEKTLTERVVEREAKKTNVGKSKNMADFIILKNDIAQTLSDGCSMKSIWETLTDEKKISFSYKTFRVYVSKYIVREKVSKQENAREGKNTEVESKPENKIKGFTFNPVSNIEELF